uniref:CST complex subunit TEN1 n=1 Tax=Denticeps clupeoides TaxID=299321 RepID=A0AAY4AAB0_9TELE
MLPPPAPYFFPWEIRPGSQREGASVRTFGRLTSYFPEESKAVLSSQHASSQHQVQVQTGFVEPFNPIVGAQYIVLGELTSAEGGGVAVRARVFNCVDGVDVDLLQKAIRDQRSFFQETRNEPDVNCATTAV